MYLDAASPSSSAEPGMADHAVQRTTSVATPVAKTATPAAFVEEAAGWAGFLLKTEVARHGDTDQAMRRAAKKAGVPHSRFWSLVRRPQTLKDIGASIYFSLHHAYQAECERQQRLLQHELDIARAKAGPRSALVRAAARLGGEEVGGAA